MHRTRAILARGDPGFFDFIKKVGSVVGQTISSVASRSPIGTAVSIGRSVFAPSGGPAARPLPPVRRLGPVGGAIIAAAAPRVVDRAFDAVSSQGIGGIQPAGTHPNKSSYFLRDGTFVPARSRYVRNRTRNNANGKALRKAIGRAKGFDNLVKRNRKALRSLARI